MKIEDVKKLSPRERFFYWIKERHQIHLRRQAGKPKPWTDDEVLQSYFFTNPYRENDKVTVWFRENVREPLRDKPEVLMATVIFRWFNLPSTGEILITNGLLTNWDRQKAVTRLGIERGNNRKIFTGAFVINSPPGKLKLEAICDRIQNVWDRRNELLGFIDSEEFRKYDFGLYEFHQKLTQFEGLGGFMAYEIVCDLRYTYLLENAYDKMTWCNPGPGCVRGLQRINGASKNDFRSVPPQGWKETMTELLKKANRHRGKRPLMEMREIEHSLCEFDKYERLLWEEGRSKRMFDGK